MGILSKLEPNRVFYYFEEICQMAQRIQKQSVIIV